MSVAVAASPDSSTSPAATDGSTSPIPSTDARVGLRDLVRRLVGEADVGERRPTPAPSARASGGVVPGPGRSPAPTASQAAPDPASRHRRPAPPSTRTVGRALARSAPMALGSTSRHRPSPASVPGEPAVEVDPGPAGRRRERGLVRSGAVNCAGAIAESGAAYFRCCAASASPYGGGGAQRGGGDRQRGAGEQRADQRRVAGGVAGAVGVVALADRVRQPVEPLGVVADGVPDEPAGRVGEGEALAPRRRSTACR